MRACLKCEAPAMPRESMCPRCLARAIRAERRSTRRGTVAQAEQARPLVDRLLLPAEIADRLRCDPSTVYRLIAAGKLRGVRVGSRVKVKLSSLERYLVEHRTRRL